MYAREHIRSVIPGNGARLRTRHVVLAAGMRYRCDGVRIDAPGDRPAQF